MDQEQLIKECQAILPDLFWSPAIVPGKNNYALGAAGFLPDGLSIIVTLSDGTYAAWLENKGSQLLPPEYGDVLQRVLELQGDSIAAYCRNKISVWQSIAFPFSKDDKDEASVQAKLADMTPLERGLTELEWNMEAAIQVIGDLRTSLSAPAEAPADTATAVVARAEAAEKQAAEFRAVAQTLYNENQKLKADAAERQKADEEKTRIEEQNKEKVSAATPARKPLWRTRK